ncbi:chemotaxis protein [Vibrio cholerae]|nr:chemotaxis protein [Vibrio cholerae]
MLSIRKSICCQWASWRTEQCSDAVFKKEVKRWMSRNFHKSKKSPYLSLYFAWASSGWRFLPRKVYLR